MTMRTRLVMFVLALLTLVLGGLGLFVAGSLERWSTEVLDEELEHRASVIEAEVKWEHGELEIEEDADVGARGWPWRLESLDGRVLATSPGWPKLEGALGARPFETHGSMRVHSRTFRPHGRHGTELVLRVVAPAGAFAELTKRFRVGLLVAVALALVLGALGAAAVAQVSLSPLRRLSSDVARIEARSLGTRLSSRGLGPELGVLASAFNAVLARLEQAFEGQRAFVSRASHALRTPLASILTRAEVTLRRERTSEEYRAALEEIAAAASASATLAQGLLALNRADSAKGEAKRERVLLSSLAAELGQLFKVRAEEGGLSLETAAPAELAVEADRSRLRELLDALMDNAVRYTPRGGRVVFEARVEGSDAVLEVRDTGPGIAADERDKVLEPFFRGRAAETTGQPGSGLGLAVVRALAEAEGATLRLDGAPGGGTRVTVRLPRSA